LKLIHTIPTINEEASGPSYSVVRLCESEMKQGADLSLAALDWAPLLSPPRFLKTFPLGIGPRKLGGSPVMRKWLQAQASSGNIDLIHNHSLWMMPNVYPGPICWATGVPLILSPRGTLSRWAMQSGSLVKKFFWPLVQRPVLENTACFHATAYSEYDDIRRLGFRQPIAVIPNGVDMPMVRGNKSETGRTLLFLGRIHPVKGLDMLLPAWKILQLRFPEWRLQIVGPDNRGHQEKMQTLAQNLGLHRIEFCGPRYGEAKIQTYADADLFVLPTYSENFGMAVAEALAAGIPAVVTKGAPWAGLVEQQAGWWVDTNAEALVAGLEAAMAKSRSELSQMGQNGKTWMATEYSWTEIGKRMLQTYEWVLHGGSAPEWVLEV
jgi:glycosyltransferase involved in cell wall biosynthesis